MIAIRRFELTEYRCIAAHYLAMVTLGMTMLWLT